MCMIYRFLQLSDWELDKTEMLIIPSDATVHCPLIPGVGTCQTRVRNRSVVFIPSHLFHRPSLGGTMNGCVDAKSYSSRTAVTRWPWDYFVKYLVRCTKFLGLTGNKMLNGCRWAAAELTGETRLLLLHLCVFCALKLMTCEDWRTSIRMAKYT